MISFIFFLLMRDLLLKNLKKGNLFFFCRSNCLGLTVPATALTQQNTT